MNNLLKSYPNFRDIGGLETTSGRKLKSEVLFRSGFLSKLEGEDLETFKRLGIGKVIDLRTNEETALLEQGNYPENTEYCNIPLNSGNITKMLIPIFEKGEFQLIEEGLLAKIYIDMISKFEKEIALVFRQFLETDASVVYHCSHGKDRTGLVSALFLDLMDVKREQIYLDYLKSNELRERENAYQIKMIKENFTKRFNREVSDEEFAPVQQLFVCQQEILENVFDHIDREYDSIAGYFEGKLNFTNSEIHELKEKYLA